MLRKGHIIRIKRDGKVIKEIGERVVPVKRPPVKVKASTWGKVGLSEQRATIDRPKRNQLSGPQWANRSWYLKILCVPKINYMNADNLSLADLKDAYDSTVKMTKYRCMVVK